MKRLLILFLLFATPALADRKTEELAIVTVAAADIVTTEINLSKGLVEQNPLMQDRAVRIGAKAAIAGGNILVARWLDNTGHDKIATWTRRVTIGMWAGAAGYNVYVGVRFSSK